MFWYDMEIFGEPKYGKEACNSILHYLNLWTDYGVLDLFEIQVGVHTNCQRINKIPTFAFTKNFKNKRKNQTLENENSWHI